MLEPCQADTLIYVTKSIREVLMLSTLFSLSYSVLSSPKKFVLRNSLPLGPYSSAAEFRKKNVRAHLWAHRWVMLVSPVTVDMCFSLLDPSFISKPTGLA